MYDMRCCEMVWEADEYDGTLLALPSSQQWIGIYSNSGIWLLRSHRISEHTQLLSNALFPITTNADEVPSNFLYNTYLLTLNIILQTTPGDYLQDGRVISATRCKLWSLLLPATRYGLLALRGTIHNVFNHVFLHIIQLVSNVYYREIVMTLKQRLKIMNYFYHISIQSWNILLEHFTYNHQLC